MTSEAVKPRDALEPRKAAQHFCERFFFLWDSLLALRIFAPLKQLTCFRTEGKLTVIVPTELDHQDLFSNSLEQPSPTTRVVPGSERLATAGLE